MDIDTELESYRGHAQLPVAELSDESESLLLYTSGSTGRPKGVVQSHASQLWMLNALAPPPQFVPPDQRMLVAAPLYHKNGMFSSKLALLMGAAIVLLPRFTAVDYIEAIAEHRCTLIGWVPTMYALVVRERELLARSDLSCVKRITIGSAPLTGALLDEVRGVFPNATITNGYGTTESGPAAFGMHPELKPTPMRMASISSSGAWTTCSTAGERTCTPARSSHCWSGIPASSRLPSCPSTIPSRARSRLRGAAYLAR